MGHFVEAVHPLVVRNPFGFEAIDELGLEAIHLAADDDCRVFEHRLYKTQEIERVLRIIWIEPFDGLNEEERKVVEEREVHLQVLVHGDPEIAAGGVALHANNAGAVERTGELRRALEVVLLAGVVVVAVGDEPPHGGEVTARWIVDRGVALQEIDQHPGCDPKA